jgi:predicted dehydrogenase
MSTLVEYDTTHTMRQLRVGIVGCGEVTQIVHLPSLAKLAEQFTVTALCDLSDQDKR